MTVEHVLHTTNAPAMCVVGPIVVEQRADRQVALTVTLAVIVTHAVQGTTRCCGSTGRTSAPSVEVARRALPDPHHRPPV